MKYDFTPEFQMAEQKFTGCSPETVEQLVSRFLTEFPRVAAEEWGIPVEVRRDDVDAGGIKGGLKRLAKLSDGSEDRIPAVVISSAEHKDYARVLVAFQLMGRVCYFRVCQVGLASGNFRRVRQGKLLGNKREFEKETTFYQAMVQISQELMNL